MTNYYLDLNGEQKGPYTMGQLRSMWHSGDITEDILFWQADFGEWIPLSTIIDLLETAPPVSRPRVVTLPPSIRAAASSPKKSRSSCLSIFYALAIVLISFLVISFFSSPRSADENEGRQRFTDGGTFAELVSSRLVPYTTPSGLQAQMALIEWRNTGSTAIRAVNADITAIDESGAILGSSVKNYCIYASANSRSGVLPGEVYVPPNGEGFVVFPSLIDGKPASRIIVRITNAKENSSL